MFPLKMALKLIKSSLRQTIIIITAITLAIGVQFFIASLSNILNNLIVEQATTYQEHLLVLQKWDESGNYLPPNYELREKIEQIPEVKYAFFGSMESGTIQSDSLEEQAFSIYSMENQHNRGDFLDFYGLRLEENIVRGRVNDPNKNEIMLDDYFAKRNNINIDDLIKIKRPTDNMEVELSVVGTFDNGIFRLIRNYAYLSFDITNSYPRGRTHIYIQVENPLEVDLVRNKILEIIDEHNIDNIIVNTWKTSNPETELLDMAQKAVVFVIQVLIAVATFIVVMSILNFTIQQKTSQIGIIKAIGGNNKLITKVFMYKSLILTTISTVLGLGIGSFSMWLYHSSMRYPDGGYRFVYEPLFINYLMSVILVLTAVILATFASLRKVKKTKIIELIKT